LELIGPGAACRSSSVAVSLSINAARCLLMPSTAMELYNRSCAGTIISSLLPLTVLLHVFQQFTGSALRS
jgi:hypothetical protein